MGGGGGGGVGGRFSRYVIKINKSIKYLLCAIDLICIASTCLLFH